MFRCIFSADFRHTLKVAGKVDIKKNDRFFVLHLPEGDECIISPGDEVKRIGSFTSEVKAVSHSRPGVFFVDIDRASTVSSGKKAVYLRCGANSRRQRKTFETGERCYKYPQARRHKIPQQEAIYGYYCALSPASSMLVVFWLLTAWFFSRVCSQSCVWLCTQRRSCAQISCAPYKIYSVFGTSIALQWLSDLL